MTQNTEQKDRTFRSRDSQALAMAQAMQDDHTPSPTVVRLMAKELSEAEARGAEEQRRKDAEGQEAVAWIRPNALPCQDYPWIETELRIEKSETYSMALHTRPANVPALEARIAELKESEQLAWDYAEASKARVKVLEEALLSAVSALEQVTEGERGGYNARNGKFVSLQMSDGERADIIHSDVTTECEGALETARAALTREGGV